VNVDQLLSEWRANTLSDLSERLDKLFDASADVMLEYAEKAQSDHLRGRFYEAIRELRLRRAQVSEHFHAGIARVIFRFDAMAPPDSPGRHEVLSLVDPDDFERSLALKTIVEHAERDHGILLRAIGKRLAKVSGARQVTLENIPAGPRQLASQFAASTSLMYIEHEARLALYTLFERFVIQDTMASLAQLNARLAELGVLPDVEIPKIERPSDQPAQDKSETAPDARTQQDSADAGAPLGDEVLLRIRDLLAMRRAQRRPKAARPPGSPAPAPAPVSEVVQAIGGLPGSPAPVPAAQAGQSGVAVVSLHDLQGVRRSLSSQRDRIREQIGEERVTPDIDDVIEIVGAIFEAMLNEHDLPNAAKALLSHLHTPYLKYAVTDPRVLDDPKHPARRWLDELVQVASEWIDQTDLNKGLYPWISKAVLRVMNSSQLNRDVFEELRAGLDRELRQITKKQQSMELRAAEHAKGKARLQRAQQLMRQELDRLLGEHPGAAVAEGFLRETWADYLTLILLRSNNNPSSDEVRQAVHLGRRVCDVAARVARSSAPDHAEIDRLAERLERHIGALIPHLKPRIGKFADHLKAGARQPATAAPAAARSAEAPAPSPEADADAQLTPEETKVAARLCKLPAGTRFWRQMVPGQGEATIRLVWFNPQTAKFMFVDLAGQTAGMVPIKELASEILLGRARVLEEPKETFFERAMNAFQALLKQGL
jgi:hypothetical protein